MKHFVILFALFATTFAQQKCMAKTKDGFFMTADAFGSLYNGSQPNMYYSFVGQLLEVVEYLADNPSSSVVYLNATLIISNGVTGKEVVSGSFITFMQNGMHYNYQVINGQKGNCSSGPSPPITQPSKVVSNLNTIWPLPGVPLRPGENTICQGSVEQLKEILNLVWNGSEKNDFLYMDTLTETASTHVKVLTYRDLTPADRPYLNNPCPHKGGEFKGSTEHSQLIDAVYHAMRHLY